MAGQPGFFHIFGWNFDQMAGGGLRSGRSVLKSREESNGVTVMEWIFPKSRKPIFRGCHFFGRKQWKSKNCDFARNFCVFGRKFDQMKSWGVGEGRSVLIFSEEFDFQGPRVRNSRKQENRKIRDFGFRIFSAGRPAGRPFTIPPT